MQLSTGILSLFASPLKAALFNATKNMTVAESVKTCGINVQATVALRGELRTARGRIKARVLGAIG